MFKVFDFVCVGGWGVTIWITIFLIFHKRKELYYANVDREKKGEREREREKEKRSFSYYTNLFKA